MPWFVEPFVKATNSCCVEFGLIPAELATFVMSVPSVKHMPPAVPTVQAGGELPVLMLLVVAMDSAVLMVVPLSVMLELAGAPPAPPPFTRMFVLSIADDDSCVVELKYGIPPEVTVPATVTGKLGVPAAPPRTMAK